MGLLKCIIAFAFLLAADSSKAQFRHFPPGQRMVFTWWSNSETTKGYYDTLQTKIDSDSIFYKDLTVFNSYQNPCIDIFSKSTASLGHPRFYEDSTGITIKTGKDTLIQIPHWIQIKDTFYWNHKKGVVVNRFDLYKNGNFVDSAWFFYLIDRGYLLDSLVLGKNVGWIKLGNDIDYTQVGYYQGDSLIGNNTLDWKIFFPEEPGDWKRYTCNYKDWSSNYIGEQVLDSFIEVKRYTDSIRITKKRWSMGADGFWDAQTKIIDTLIRPAIFKDYFGNRDFGNTTMLESQSDSATAIVNVNFGMEIHSKVLYIFLANTGYFFQGTDTCILQKGRSGLSRYKETVGMEIETDPIEGITLNLIGGHIGDSAFGYSFVSLPFAGEEPVNIYPNPTRSEIYVHSENTPSRYQVFTLNGIEMPITVQNSTIDLRHLPPGAYVLLIWENEKVHREIFIKE